jgi:hypothetical protein
MHIRDGIGFWGRSIMVVSTMYKHNTQRKKQGFTQLQACNKEILRVAYVFVLLMMMSHQGGDKGLSYLSILLPLPGSLSWIL